MPATSKPISHASNADEVILTVADQPTVRPISSRRDRRSTTGSQSTPRRRRPQTLAPNQRVGAWRVEYQLGRGGMGSVYAVTHNGFGKRAALKVCHTSILDDDVSATTFVREARIVNMIDHPCVPDVFAVGTYDGRPYLAMERLAGETLGQRIDREGPLSRVEAIDILLELCDVLGAAHLAGVVHRDLKLDNVFMLETPGPGGHCIKLVDWGIARITGEEDPMQGLIAGTLTYVSPEQAHAEEVTPASDVYSLGVLAYQLLFGAPPFASEDDFELLDKHLHARPPTPRSLWPEIPKELSDLLVGMLAKDAGWRPTLDEIVRVFLGARHELRPAKPSWHRRLRAVVGVPAMLTRSRHRVIAAAFGVVAAAGVLTLLGV